MLHADGQLDALSVSAQGQERDEEEAGDASQIELIPVVSKELRHRDSTTLSTMAGLRTKAQRLARHRKRELRNPMREHSTEYVINMWKVYNHLHLGERHTAQLLSLFIYAAYVYFLTYLLAHVPPPATMLRHAEAVSDLLLGEEFDQQTTHIYKSWYDVMTEQELWEWAYGPLAAAVGGRNGSLDALLGTNWLIGPVRIRQARSRQVTDDCRSTLQNVFGPATADELYARGVKCTRDWEELGRENVTDPEFLDFSYPLSSLGECTYASAACATANAHCKSAEEVDCAKWNGDEDGCREAGNCTFAKQSFVLAFPQWWEQLRNGSCADDPSSDICQGRYCCSHVRCYKSYSEQEEHATNEDKIETACSMRRFAANLTWNPKSSYRSKVRMDSTESESLWAKAMDVGDGGYHIDLPGDSATLVPMLKGLQELGFIDQFTRSVDFQLVLMNSNRFSVAESTMLSSPMTRATEHHPVVMVNVDLNFMFSPSGFLSKYDRITAVQLNPTHRSNEWHLASEVLPIAVPICMLLLEIAQINDLGLVRWISDFWNFFSILYILSMWLCLDHVMRYFREESEFLDHYKNISSFEYFNDMMPLRDSYKDMNKFIGVFMFCSWLKVFKYTKIFRSSQVLWNTLSAARYQLIAYSLVMLLMINAFAMMTVMLWGYNSKFFHNVPTAFFALVRLAAGEADMEYAELKRGDSSMTPFVFMTFILVVAVIGMNMMVAIVTDFYEKARNEERAWNMDTRWIQATFSGKTQYEDFYRGKGLWNEPVAESILGPIGELWSTLRGHWVVKPIPIGCGPRKWNAIEEKVESKFETQKYPFVLHRSSLVYLRYRVESHEHDERCQQAHVQQEHPGAEQLAEADMKLTKPLHAHRLKKHHGYRQKLSRSSEKWNPLVSRDKSEISCHSPEDTRTKRERINAPRQPVALNVWMAPENFSQYKGTSYLELLKGPTYKGKPVDTMDRPELQEILKELLLEVNSNPNLNRESLHGLNTDQLRESLHGLNTDELQDRLRDLLAGLQRTTEACTAQGSASQTPQQQHIGSGDELSLLTSEEGGEDLPGEIVLEFQKLMPVRRATKADKAAITVSIEDARENYHEALEQGHALGQCYQHSTVADGDRLDGAKGCRLCAKINACRKRAQECEQRLQELHGYRAALEGVERIMVFRVKSVDAWQKFRPMDIRSDDVAGKLGEKLKDQCQKNSEGLDVITKEDVLQVLVEVVANVMRHEWIDGRDSTRAELEKLKFPELLERAQKLNLDAISLDHCKKRRLIDMLQERTVQQQDDDADEQVFLDSLEIKTTEELMVLANARLGMHEQEVIVDVLLEEEIMQSDHISKLRQEWLDIPCIGGQRRRELIREEVEQVMRRMAAEEKKANERKEQALNSSPKTSCRPHNIPHACGAAVEDVMTCLTDKKTGERCLIEHLLQNHNAPHPRLTSVMRRLLNKAQRVSSSFAHAPQLEVAESSKFQLRVPLILQTKIVKRATCDRFRLRSSWAVLCNALDWFIPLGFITRNCYFHASVESQVDEFLHSKCAHASAAMPDEVARSLTLQMEEFMSPAHSVTLSEFMCVSMFLCSSVCVRICCDASSICNQ
eukprot:COSAG02_NODE_449_length_22094_cov_4.917027_15_plen_1590_part_00